MVEIGVEARALLGELEAIAAAPMDRATAMPPGLYLSDEILALEQERIFAREWFSPGLAAEIPDAGDYLTFSVGEQPVFCTRGKDGVIRTFANVCRHRMMQLLEGRGRKGRIVCPYHAWTYDLKGKLVHASHMDKTEDFDASGICLPEIRTEIWHGWIYVTLNDQAPAVADLLAPLDGVVSRYRLDGYVPVLHQDHVWQTNWKLLTENFMEGYHLPVAHKKTVGAWFPADSVSFPKQVYEAFTYQTFTKTKDARYGLAHRDNKVLRGKWRNTTVMPTVFPTHMYVLAPDHMWYLSLRPRGTGEVMVRFGAAIAPEVMAGLDDPKQFLAETGAFFDAVNDEDRFVVEGIYKGAVAPLTRPGPLSWLERSIHDFSRYLARTLGADVTIAAREAAQ